MSLLFIFYSFDQIVMKGNVCRKQEAAMQLHWCPENGSSEDGRLLAWDDFMEAGLKLDGLIDWLIE